MRLLTKRHSILLTALVLTVSALQAETKEERAESPHELRIGIGDPVISRVTSDGWYMPDNGGEIWRRTWGKTAEEADVIMRDGRYSLRRGKTHVLGHFFLEYQYRINSYIGVGLNTDVYNIWNDYDVYNGYREKVGEYTYGYLYMDFVPRVRFTFLHKQYVNLYASTGVGFAMYTSYNGEYFQCAPKIEATLFGVSIGKNGFFGAFEFMNMGVGLPYMDIVPIQIFTASVGYRF